MAAASQYIGVAEAGRHCRLRLQAVVVFLFFFFFPRVWAREDKIGAFLWGEVNTNMVGTDRISHQSCKRARDTFLQQVLGSSETHDRWICC